MIPQLMKPGVNPASQQYAQQSAHDAQQVGLMQAQSAAQTQSTQQSVQRMLLQAVSQENKETGPLKMDGATGALKVMVHEEGRGKWLVQVNPAPITLTALYTVADKTRVEEGVLVICNQGVAGTFRVSLALVGAADGAHQYLEYDTALAANVSVRVAIYDLQPTDVVRVYVSHGNFSCNLFGKKIAVPE